MSVTFGFQLEDVVDNVAKTEFAHFMAAMQQLVSDLRMIDVPFSTGHLVGVGGTVTAVDTTSRLYTYRVVGDVMELSFSLTTITVGAGVTAIQVRIPDGYVVAAVGGKPSTAGWINDAGTGRPALIEATPGNDYVTVYRADLAAWTAGTTTQIRGQIQCRVVRAT